MSARSSGNEAVTEAARLLESWGYKVHVFRNYSVRKGRRWIQVGGDLWGAFDIAAVGTAGFFFVQVTDVDHAAARRRKVDETWSWPRLPDVMYEVWAWNRSKRTFTTYFRDYSGSWVKEPSRLS